MALIKDLMMNSRASQLSTKLAKGKYLGKYKVPVDKTIKRAEALQQRLQTRMDEGIKDSFTRFN